MSNEKLEENLGKFYDEMAERLEGLSPKEQQQYLEGLVHAFDSYTRYANPEDVTPIEREDFMGSAKSEAYSRTHHLKLDPEARMEELMKTDDGAVLKSYMFAKMVQEALGIELNHDEQITLMNLGALYSFKGRARNDLLE